jgi:hypothetical protein
MMRSGAKPDEVPDDALEDAPNDAPSGGVSASESTHRNFRLELIDGIRHANAEPVPVDDAVRKNFPPHNTAVVIQHLQCGTLVGEIVHADAIHTDIKTSDLNSIKENSVCK